MKNGDKMNNPNPPDIASRMKLLRKLNKLTQAEFAARLDLSKILINRIESGAIIPSEDFVKHTCKTFMVYRKWLLTGKGVMLYKFKEVDENAKE